MSDARRIESQLKGMMSMLDAWTEPADLDWSALRQPTDASDFRDQLEEIISTFESNLQSDQEVGLRLVSFGADSVMHLQRIGFADPGLIRFFGHTATGEPVELVQHVSQISVLLMRLSALDPESPRRIGFTGS